MMLLAPIVAEWQVIAMAMFVSTHQCDFGGDAQCQLVWHI